MLAENALENEAEPLRGATRRSVERVALPLEPAVAQNVEGVAGKQVDRLRGLPRALQLRREPRPLPRLNLKRRPATIFDYQYEDFELTGYEPHPHIAAPISK